MLPLLDSSRRYQINTSGTRENQDVIKIDYVKENKCHFYAFFEENIL